MQCCHRRVVVFIISLPSSCRVRTPVCTTRWYTFYVNTYIRIFYIGAYGAIGFDKAVTPRALTCLCRSRMVARFEFSDRDEKKKYHWLVIEENEIDLCYVNPGLEVDTWVETDLRSMVEVWMGWRPLKDALSEGDIAIYGAPNLTQDPLRWIGQSPVAGISQRPSEEQVLVLIEKVRA